MGSEWTIDVTHYDKTNSWASQIIKSNTVHDTDELPLFTDTSGGTINTATIVIDANEGHYIRDQRGGESGFPTKIDHNDRIRIIMDDKINSGEYNRVFEVVKKVPIKTKGIGAQLRVELEGIERHLQKIMYSSRRIFDTPFLAAEDLVAYYNEQRTTDMPSLTFGTIGNLLPNEGIHHFDWGINEETVYNRIVELVDKMGSSGEAGGVLDFFEFHITTNAANVTSMFIDIFSSGLEPPTITIDADTVNTGDTDGGIDEAAGTIIGMWGENGKGSLPTDWQRFKGRQQLFPQTGTFQFAEYDTNVLYKPDSIVAFEGTVFWNPVDALFPPPAFPWKVLTPALYYGENDIDNYGGADSVPQYSPWTQNKATLWENGAVDILGTGAFGNAFFDGNMIKNDDSDTPTFASWVHLRITDGIIPDEYTYGQIGANGWWDGLRVLVDEAVPSIFPFNGTDPNGVDYGRSVVQYEQKRDEWIVIFDILGDGKLEQMVVNVLRTGEAYRNDAGFWTDITTENNAMDWSHPWDSFGNVPSLIGDADTQAQFGAPNNNSALEVRYTWKPLPDWFKEVAGTRNDVNWYQAGAWLSFMWPFPTNSFQGIGEDPGQVYGGGIQGEAGTIQPTQIDTQNMTWTHNGFRGFNIVDANASSLESEDLGQLSSIDFLCKLKYEFTYAGPTTTVLLPKGNFKMRAWLFDKFDKVVSQDFIIPFNDETTAISLPLQGFKIYRGKRARDLNFTLNDIFPPKGLSHDDIFRFDEVVAFCFGTLDSYDSFGRYAAGLGTDFGPGIQDLINLLKIPFLEVSRQVTLTIDAFRFGKPLLAITNSVDAAAPDFGITLAKIPEFKQEPTIGNYVQLKNAARAELEKAHFKKTEYDMTTEIRHDLEFGRFFNFIDNETVDETDNGIDNQVQLVAKHVEYSITKPLNGKGGALRRIRGSRRFI